MNTTTSTDKNDGRQKAVGTIEHQRCTNDIICVLNKGTKYILLTGDEHCKKDELIISISNKTSSSHRIIDIKGKELLFPEEINNTHPDSGLIMDQSTCSYDFDLFIDLIIESIKLEENIILIIEDVDYIPVRKLIKLFNVNNAKNGAGSHIQFLMTGLPSFVNSIQAAHYINPQKFIHIPIKNYVSDKNLDSEPINQIESKTHPIIKDLNKGIEKPKSKEKPKTKKKNVKKNLERKDNKQTLPVQYSSKEKFSYNRVRKIDTNFKYTYENSLKKKLARDKLHQNKIASSKNSLVPILEEKNLSKIDILNLIRTTKNNNHAPSDLPKLHYCNSRSVEAAATGLIIESENDFKIIKHTNTIPSRFENFSTYTVVLLFLISLTPIFYNQTESNFDGISNEVELFRAMEDFSNTYLAGRWANSIKDNMRFDVIEKNNETNIIEGQASYINEISNDDVNHDNTEKNKIAEGEIVETLSHDKNIQDLLEIAEQQKQDKKLTSPIGDNAYETYQFILSLDSRHTEAIKGIQDIHDIYIGWANYNYRDHKYSRAKRYLSKALTIQPDNSSTLASLNNIKEVETINYENKNKVIYRVSLSDEPDDVQLALTRAYKIIRKIEADLKVNHRDYRMHQHAQQIYKNVLKKYPSSKAANVGLIKIKNLYLNWAENEYKSRNYHSSKFLFEQARLLDPHNQNIKRRMDDVKMISNNKESKSSEPTFSYLSPDYQTIGELLF